MGTDAEFLESGGHTPEVEVHDESHRADPRTEAIRGLAEFRQLKRSFAVFVIPASIVFFGWYMFLIIGAAYAPDFLARDGIGPLNVGFLIAFSQFLTTFAIAWLYTRYARRRLDPLADAIREQAEEG